MSFPYPTQAHADGYEGSRDPLEYLFQGDVEPDFQSHLPEEVDVLIVGAGPAGHLLATQLSRFANITTRLIDAKHGRLEHGYADGLQCRTIEIFEAFGFSEKIIKEAYWVNELCFWSPTEDGKGIRRTGRLRDSEQDLSEEPHVILSQARMQDYWRESMKKSPTRLEPTYSRRLVGLSLPNGDEPIEVTIERTDDDHRGELEHVKAKYVVGCDGARSAVRQLLGWRLKGDSANQAWGVLDVLASTNFPDIRLKCTIHSAEHGTILLVPREGGYMTRVYVELDKLNPDERIRSKNITKEMLVERVKRIFHPYTFEAREIPYTTVYEVGQRLTDHFDDVAPSERDTKSARIFTAGDACHTHSAKAGQGMNVSMNDTFNLGWKLAAVLNGVSPPKILNTYSEERQAIAQGLIDFDRGYSAMFAKKPRANAALDDPIYVDPKVFQQTFQRAQRFTAGVETRYLPGLLTSADKQYQHLATGFQIGTRFHSALVLRVADAKPVHLGHTLKANGLWRIVLFSDRTSSAEIVAASNDDNFSISSPTSTAVAQMCQFLADDLIPRYTRSGANVDSVIDVRAVFQQRRHEIDVMALPPLLCPPKGKLGLYDYEKAFTDEESYGWGFGNIYSARGVDREKGCVLVIRPDQYISAVLPLSDEAHTPMREFFDGFMNVVN